MSEDPEFDEWIKTNSWYLQDPDMTHFANGYVHSPEVKNLPQRERLNAVEQAVKQTFSQRFENPSRNRPAGVDAGASRGGPTRPGGRGFGALPPEAKEAADRYVAKGLFKSKEDYAKKYFESEGD
jgi:hypothetical protein